MNDFLKEHLPAILTGILGLGAWLFEKRKKNAELQVAESDAIQAMQASYRTFVADMNSKYDEIKLELTAVKLELEEQRRENSELKKEYAKLKAEMNNIENGVQTTPNNGRQG